MTSLDIGALRRWIGNEDRARDLVTASLVERFRATTRGDRAGGSAAHTAPRLIHFCLCQPAAPMDALGEDGHPARGGFLPPVPLPRRMWAASDIVFHGDLAIGDIVDRRSVVADVVHKQGKTGELCFVTVDHVYSVGGDTRIEDRQTIVYRALQAAPAPAGSPAPAGEVIDHVDPSTAMLFRYSALTFNSHRIHYDAPYATGVEGYPGLVVHGPLQATLLLQLAGRVRGREPDRLSFQSVSTLYDSDRIVMNAAPGADDALSLWTARPDGPFAMRAEARWA